MPLRPRRPWSLRTRLVVSAVALIAVVAAVIGTVTTIAYRSYLYDRADEQLTALAQRAAGPPAVPFGPDPGRDREPLAFLGTPGSPIGTLGAVVDGGEVTEAGYSTEVPGSGTGDGPRFPVEKLDAAQESALADVPRDGRAHTVELPGGLGSYRVVYAEGVHGTFLTGIPLTEVESALSTLVLVELSLTGASLAAASLAGTVLVRIALRPLRRVAATASQVARLPLHSGEVALHQRVPEAEADPRTEVGQVGAALNRMLDHVHAALDARQQSETRVRRFVADASHELRTPLASIRGYAELTRRGREECGPDTRHALGRIESEATRMTGLVEDLLLLARLDAGRPLSYESTDLVPLVVDAVGDARAAGPDHHWRLDLPDHALEVTGDEQRLHQVVTNLLTNARRYTPPGTTVTVSAHEHGFAVHDDGPGFPPELADQAFERFARADASRTRGADSGAGLGLALVQAIVHAHGGRVTLASRPGDTTLTVTLPGPAGSRPGPAATPSGSPAAPRG